MSSKPSAMAVLLRNPPHTRYGMLSRQFGEKKWFPSHGRGLSFMLVTFSTNTCWTLQVYVSPYSSNDVQLTLSAHAQLGLRTWFVSVCVCPLSVTDRRGFALQCFSLFDPFLTAYILVICTPHYPQVLHYVEKPETFVSNIINAGGYIFSPDIFQHLTRAFTANSNVR